MSLRCPSKVSAAWLTNEVSGPCSDPGCGPSWALSWVSWSLTSSHSTGTAVRSTPMTVPLAMTAPSAYTGVSSMNRAETRFGATNSACASAGIWTPPPMDIRTVVCSGDGSMESMVPTGTPATFTSSPGYSPTAEEKYAWICNGLRARPHQVDARPQHHDQVDESGVAQPRRATSTS